MNHTNTNYLTSDSVVLITGGGKGITAKCAIEIAKKAQCKLVLVGRSALLESEPEWANGKINEKELKVSALSFYKNADQKVSPKELEKEIQRITSSREIQNTLAEIERTGAQAVYCSADVTKKDSLAAALKFAVTPLGKISGVIHGAGNLADKRIEKKTGTDFDIVVNTKIKGLENIFETIDSTVLKFLVLFSSVAGFYGNSGQTDYSIANEILNKSAHLIQQKLPECRVLSINWGPWDSGMVSPRLKRFFETKNIPMISSEEGVKVLVDELTNENIQTQIVVGNQLDMPVKKESKDMESISIRRSISHNANPFLNDHRLGEQVVLPATCASAWIVDSCMALHPGYVFIAMDDFKVLKGLTFNDDEHTCDIQVKPANGSENGTKSFSVQVLSVNENGRKVFHYSGNVTIAEKRLEIPAGKSIREMGIDGNIIKQGKELYVDGTLFHGPIFQGIQEVLEISENRVVTKVSLPEMSPELQGQFTVKNVNPYINDAVVQSMLIWTQAFYDAPCLPSRLHHWDNFRTPQFSQHLDVILDITYHNENAVIGDILVQDSNGNAFYTYKGLEGTISKHLKRFFVKKTTAAG